MGIIARHYQKEFVHRFDKEIGVPYYETKDFPHLKEEKDTFVNKKGLKIAYFYFYYEGYQKDEIILFLPGLSCGHVAYFREINEIASRGYKVLTIDYTGCGESEGKCLGSLNAPTSDVIDLLNLLKLKEEIKIVGHSLGGYTALNLMNLRKELTRGVVISPFIDIEAIIKNFVPNKFILKRVLKYENKVSGQYSLLNNLVYLRAMHDDLLFIHSTDDQMVPYEVSTKKVEELNNPQIKFIIRNNRKHNPQYTDDAVKYLNDVFNQFYTLINEKKIVTDEDKKNYFKDVSLERLTNQDPEITNAIINFLK